MAIAGRVAIVPKGNWSADATYKRLDAVTYNNTLYFAKKDVPAGTATSNTEYWSKSIVGGVGAIAKPEEAGIVKPDGKSMSVDESGTLSINLDGTTITLDEAKNVIKLADTLKDAIDGAFPAANVANNQITTAEGFALDARQANPNIDGSLAKQISDLNGSIMNSYNSRIEFSAKEASWYRFAKMKCNSISAAEGCTYGVFSISINRGYNIGHGMSFFTNLLLYYANGVKFANSAVGSDNEINIPSIRVVQEDKYVYLDLKHITNANNPIIIFIENKVNADHVNLSCIDIPYTVPESLENSKIIGTLDLTKI